MNMGKASDPEKGLVTSLTLPRHSDGMYRQGAAPSRMGRDPPGRRHSLGEASVQEAQLNPGNPVKCCQRCYVPVGHCKDLGVCPRVMDSH